MKYILFIILYLIIGIIICSIWIILDNKFCFTFAPIDRAGYALAILFWPLCVIIFCPLGLFELLMNYFDWLRSR